ncbi:MAG: M15 family metallopeptidase [Urechidicola sp.]|nr:M15 family metallopeptidase [Urechidicola sp.]
MKHLVLTFFISINLCAQIPKEFVYVQDEIPNIQIELRYFSDNNFVGQQIDGYEKEVLILSKEATNALNLVQLELNKNGFGLKVFDGYRPQRAVNHFYKWALDINDTLMKQQFYPNELKQDLFKKGYIATKSGHTRGSTLDVTLIDLKTGAELDMGFPYDFFGQESWLVFDKLTVKQKWNRSQLQNAMLTNGFKNYPQEWWHFTLINEPCPETYFDFVVE